jgi:cysteine desulfurase
MKIDVDALGVDTLSLSSHKMYGPKGVGALFISPAMRGRLRPIIHGGGQEDGLRGGTLPTPLCVGFGEAARILLQRLEDDIAHARQCREAFMNALHARLPDLQINGSEPRHPGHLNIRLPGVDSDNLITNLQPMLAISNGAACSSGIPEPSHVLRAMGLDDEAASQCIRIGFGRFGTEEEATLAADLIAEEAARITFAENDFFDATST